MDPIGLLISLRAVSGREGIYSGVIGNPLDSGAAKVST